MATHALEVYLQDHLAGSIAGRALAARVAPDLALEIEEDQIILEALMNDLGIEPTRTKGLAVWIAEKLSRPKQPEGLFALEMLALGVQGKIALWRALKQIADTEPYVGALDLDHLIQRAQRQFDEVERERVRKADQLFGGVHMLQYG
jgi:hypothetical protein